MTVAIAEASDVLGAASAAPRSFAELYRAAEKEAGACPIEAGVIGKLVDNECQHNRLPGDRSPACGCWPQEAPNFQSAPALTVSEAEELLPEPPRPERLPEPQPESKPVIAVPALVTKILDELDEEIDRLTRARSALSEIARRS